MSIHTVKSTRIGTLHVRGAQEESVALRLALSSLLNSADLRPVGVPPAAILIVRRLADPMPGRVAPQRRAVRVDRAWEKAAQNALADLYRRAARPSRGYVPPHAPAVRFADEGEMLASLALDISRGGRGYSRRWWWKMILRALLPPSAPQSSLLPTLLCRETRSVPAVLHHLAEWGQLFAVATALSPAQAMSVLAVMTEAHGVGDLSLDLRPTFPVGRKEISRRDASGGASAQYQTQSVAEPQKRAALATRAPWARWLPASEVPHTLAKEQVCLLGVGLSLHHRPAIVPTHAFRHALRQWWAGAPDEFAVPEQEMGASEEAKPQNDALPAKRQATDLPTGDNASLLAAGRDVPSGKAYPAPLVPPDKLEPAKEGRKREQEAIRATAKPDSSDSSLAEATQKRTTEPERAVTDEFGTPEPKKWDSRNGERPAAGHSAKAPHAKSQNNATDVAITFTDRLAEQRHRDAPSESTTDLPLPQEYTDPSFSATDRASPQERTHPSESTTDAPSPQEYTQKSQLQLEEGVVTDLGGLLYLINLMEHLELPACFEKGWQLASQIGPWGVLELLGRALLGAQRADLAADPIWQALATLDGREVGQLPGTNFRGHDSFRLPKRWGKVVTTSVVPDGPERLKSLLRPALIAGLNPHLARWLAMVLPYIRLRLYQALGISPDIPTEAQQKLVQTLFLYRGRLYVTSTHVDLVMRLAEISLPVRLAGLDFDPGWLANFGRVVKFHFE